MLKVHRNFSIDDFSRQIREPSISVTELLVPLLSSAMKIDEG
jgi:hypothetical protein